MAAGAAAIIPQEASAREKNEKRPNVIFILMDDAGYGDFGCYGQSKIETPNIDALASKGILFTDMYAGAPVSAPSRCCLMTGLHSGHAQIRSNDEMTERGDVWKLRAMIDNPGLEGQKPLEVPLLPALLTTWDSISFMDICAREWLRTTILCSCTVIRKESILTILSWSSEVR